MAILHLWKWQMPTLHELAAKLQFYLQIVYEKASKYGKKTKQRHKNKNHLAQNMHIYQSSVVNAK